MNYKKSAFTILEILIVIAILGIMIGIGVPRIQGMQSNGKLVQVQMDLNTLKGAVESYHTFTGSFPSTSPTVGASYLLGATPSLINNPLYDPFVNSGSTEYNYILSSNGSYYVICSVGRNGTSETTAISNAGLVVVGGDDVCVTNGNSSAPFSAGSTCSSNSQCQSGVCGGNNPPVCLPTGSLSIGQSCFSSGEYLDSLCQSGYCAGSWGCTTGANGANCSMSWDCQSGYCSNFICSATPSSGVGTYCGDGFGCASGYCGSYWGKCTAGSNGSACQDGMQCQSGYCVGEFCSATPGAIGADCGTYRDDTSCASGYCNNQSICTNGSNGSTCRFGSSCQSGYCVNYACSATPQSIGSSCLDNGSCGSGMYCVNKICSTTSGTATVGALCYANGDCQSGYCDTWYSRCTTGKTGAYCTRDTDCQSNICTKYQCQ